MKNLILFLTVISFSCICTIPASGQTVSTFLTGNGLNGPDGFALDGAQNLFVANWGGGFGNTVLRITPDALVSTFDSTSDAPDGLAFDQSGNLYVSNYNSGIIHKITPTGVKTQFASGLINPSALAFDTAGNLYVSNNGSTTVSKITPDGLVSIYATGFSAPLGLVFDPAGNLYVSNYNTGIIHKVEPDGTTSVFATVPNGQNSRIQYLVRGPSGYLYLPAYGHHKIYRISTSGEVTVYAGTGVPGSTNGSLDSAQFNGPNSIAMTSLGDLYISEYNANRIRKITGVEFPSGSMADPLPSPLNINSVRNWPNPFQSTTHIAFESRVQGDICIQILDFSGKYIHQTTFPNLNAGTHNIPFDCSAMTPGVYLYKLLFNKNELCREKMIRL